MKKNYIKLIIAIEVLGIVMQGMSFYDASTDQTESIERPAAGEEKEDITLEVSGAGQKSDIDISIMPQKPDEDQIDRYFELAQSEIDSSFFGENESPERVWQKVCPDSAYVGEMVRAEWDFLPRGIVDTSGNIDHSCFEDEAVVTANCVLSIEEEKREYSFCFKAVQPDVFSTAGFLQGVGMLVDRSNEANGDHRMILPKEISGQKLVWKRPVDYRGLIVCALGLITGIALFIGTGIDEKKEVQKKREEFGRQYPDIVENLSLYVGAGISLRGAFEKMEKQYLRWKKRHGNEEKAAYEKLIIMNRSVRDGAFEADALDRFGRECMHPSYRKLTLLLTQNQRHGNERLLEQLSHEEQLVREMRLRDIKSAGEMVSTKLLLPMGGLLGMILLVLIVPAMMSISL